MKWIKQQWSLNTDECGLYCFRYASLCQFRPQKRKPNENLMHLSMVQFTDIGYRKSKSNIWIATVVHQCLEGKYCRCLLTYGLHECSSMVLIGAAHMTVGAVPKETK